jgi:predicted phosphoribosyltransferase
MFVDRRQAAGQLAKALAALDLGDTALFALPRGGVVLGAEISRELKAPLGVILVNKIGHPTNPEYAVGAVAEDDEPIFNPDEVALTGTSLLDSELAQAKSIIATRRQDYCGKNIISPLMKDRAVVIIDDGVATGLTMEAAAIAAKHGQPKQVIIATPVAAVESMGELKKVADKVVVLEPPEDFKGSVGAHYQQFEQISDKEVKELLARSFTNLVQTAK